MNVQNESFRAFTDAAADAVARAIASVQREAQRERELREAEHRASMAEVKALVESVRAIKSELTDKLASVKDGAPGRDAVSPSIEDVTAALRTDAERAASETASALLAAWDRPLNGKDADPELIRTMIDEAVAALPEPAAGKDADPAVIEALVAMAVAALPPAEPGNDGLDGRDADFEAIEARMSAIAADAKQQISEAVAAIRIPEDGKSVTIEDVIPVVNDAVRDAVQRIDPPRDGVGIVEAEINADGNLMFTLSDGETRNIGRVVGRDGVAVDAEAVQEQIRQLFAEVPRPKDGRDGKLPIVTEWTDTVFYEGNVVTFDGRLFQAQRDTGKAPDHEDWLCIADRGRDGVDGKDGDSGRSLNIRGTFLEINDYRQLDIVQLNGASFVAKRDNPGPCPGEGWQLMAAQGKRGHAGERGPAGVGARGLPGSPIVGADITDEGLLTIVNGDGSTVSADLYPILSKLK